MLPYRFGLVLQILLLIAAGWWCREIWERRHSDIDAVRNSKDAVERGVVIGFWIVTVGVAAWFVWTLVRLTLYLGGMIVDVARGP